MSLRVAASVSLLSCATACFDPTTTQQPGTDSSESGSGSEAPTSAPTTTVDPETGTQPTTSTSVDPDTSTGSNDASSSSTDGPAGCGNGATETDEECDDANDVVGDGCSAACLDEMIRCDPTLVGGRNVSGINRMVAADGIVWGVPGFISSTRGRVRVIDATSPMSPEEAPAVELPMEDYPNWRARGIGLHGTDHLWIAGNNPEVLSFDISDPLAPVLDHLGGPNEIDGHLVIEDDLLLLARSVADNALLWDVAEPGTPVSLDLIGSSVHYNVGLHAPYAFVTDFDDSLEIHDITVPTASSLVGMLGGMSWQSVTRVLADDDTVFLATSNQGVYVIDYALPGAPTVLDADFGGESYYPDAALLGNFLFLPVTNGLSVFDVSDPASPVLAGSYLQVEAYTTGIAFDAQHVYLATDEGLRIIEGLPGLCAARCGNNFVEYPEQCDDGNLDAGDGCDACQDE